MDRTERLYLIDRLLRQRRATPLDAMVEAVGVSRATVKLDVEYMRERLHAPIEWDRALRGYGYADPGPGAASYALPGLWFNTEEARALLTIEFLLSSLQPGLLGPRVAPLRSRIRELLGSGVSPPSDKVRERTS